jgi:hypothetical protein
MKKKHIDIRDTGIRGHISKYIKQHQEEISKSAIKILFPTNEKVSSS